MNSGSKKAIYAAFFANFGIAIAKFTGAAITGSAGLLAEAVHSLADTGNQALLLVGGKKAQRKAGYQQVITPHIGNKELYVTSGHYEKYGAD
jgi:divalent metal cation (Fe/Co/Zn/Cd) transporter